MPIPRVERRVIVAALLVLGTILFPAIFYSRLHRVPESRYVDRDDAVITLSHARNFVEYGFIGTSPSGERIEGFSAPLQFWIAAAVYAVRPFDYHAFFRWQTLLGTLALGAVIAGLLQAGTADTSPARLAMIALSIVAAALVLASSSAFLWWHASGMENPYKSVALVAALWILDAMLRRQRTSWFAIPVLFLAAITRIDAIVPVGMLAAAFAALWLFRYRDYRGLAVAVTALAVWGVFMIWRWRYFGQWEPNTGVAQRISIARHISAVAADPGGALTQYWNWFNGVGRTLFAFQLLWLVPICLYLRANRVAMNRAVLIMTGVLACVVQFALFGPARMDAPRTVTELGIYAVLAAPLVLLACEPFGRRHLAAGAAILALSVIVTARTPVHQLEIGWGTAGFEAVADEFDRIAAAEDLPRATIANPDLGAVSWRKHFNVVDFGRLGSAAIPRSAAPGVFVAAIAQPDIIELHAPWACQYADLFGTREFAEGYVRVTPWAAADAQCPGPTGVAPVFWVRRAILKGSLSAERAFLERFRRTLDPALVEAELAQCLALPSARPCGYVGRTLFRFRPELHRAGSAPAVERLLARDSRLRLEHAFFTSADDPLWWRAVVAQP